MCDDCGFTCASKTTLNTHKMFKHGDLPPKSLTCDQCDYMCDHPTQLTSHKRIIHEEKIEPLECAHCPLQVRTQPELGKREKKSQLCNFKTINFTFLQTNICETFIVRKSLLFATCAATDSTKNQTWSSTSRWSTKSSDLGLAKSATSPFPTEEILLLMKIQCIKVSSLLIVLIVTTNVPGKRTCMFTSKTFTEIEAIGKQLLN